MNATGPKGPALFVLLFFALFGCVGVALLIFLWAPSDSFGSPPFLFRVMGSLIALMFMAMGFGVPITALRRWKSTAADLQATGGKSTGQGGYRCPHCGAGLGTDQEVSPAGDAKCTYCKRWWNIHRAP